MKISCDVILDLLPLYAEGMASEASKTLVSDHLHACESCRERAAELSAPVPAIQEPDVGIDKVRKEIRRRRWLAVGCAVLVLCSMLFAAASWLRQPIYLPMSVVEAVGTDENGWVKVSLSARAAGTNSFKFDQIWDEDGTAVITVWTYRLLEMTTAHMEPRQVTLHFDPAYAVGYFDGLNGGSVESIHMPNSLSEGRIILPRLYLSFYFSMALGLGAALVTAAFFLRKKRAGKWLLGLGSFLLCYAVCQGLVCGFSFASFYAEQELLWALAMSLCLWGALACGWGLRKKA